MAQRGRPFQPGNKLGRGRPPGSRNKKIALIEEVLAENSQLLLDKAVELALQGNVQMLRLLLGPVLPRPKDQPLNIGPSPMGTAEFEEALKRTFTWEELSAMDARPSGDHQSAALWASG